jgi:hypothetical protein
MKTYEVQLTSNSPIAFGRYYTPEVPKLDRESSADYETRTWRERAHTDKDGNVYVPALAFKNSLLAAAKYNGKTIAGQGKKTYAAKFASGVLIVENAIVGKKEDLKGLWLHVPSDGMRGGSKRVMKCFPIIENWKTTVQVIVLDEVITAPILKEFLIESGNFIGLGSLRVQNNGVLGRFTVGAVKEVKQSKSEISA